MSLGFEVELNGVAVRDASGESYSESYKGVTLFKTQVRPGLNAVIETGTMGMSSTLELVSNVDVNPYTISPTWEVQVDQFVALIQELSLCHERVTVDSFVKRTQGSAPLKFSSKRTTKDISARMGAEEVSFLRSLLCCWPAEDSRVAGIRSTTLQATGTIFSGSCVQVNFSTNLEYLGSNLIQGRHPFFELLDDMHRAHELHIVARLRDLALREQFTERDHRLLGYLFLVLHRLTFEGSTAPSKNRFLFLPRFDLLMLRSKCLNETDRAKLRDVDLEEFAGLRPSKSYLPLSGEFSKAYRLSQRGSSPVENTVEEFLFAALHANMGGRSPKVISEHIMRVPDSTLPKWVEGAENIVFEGRLDSWTQFARGESSQRSLLDEDEDDDSVSDDDDVTLPALRRGLLTLGRIVVGYDVAPHTGMVALDIEGTDEGESDGLLIPVDQRL
ncbi:hypothetical protein [Myxococcus landrumensis]|uniref:Uncharacterized protein n=1 Tax=Myxococcus landrumensis TaxID=2813577 RepID=A0ABX7NF96_9BACT|nr:hypothetical protein [Myxococcus landrumus]QSQ17151.1 hypothetical protein JY572_14285 [Myxococcus landrumus]